MCSASNLAGILDPNGGPRRPAAQGPMTGHQGTASPRFKAYRERDRAATLRRLIRYRAKPSPTLGQLFGRTLASAAVALPPIIPRSKAGQSDPTPGTRRCRDAHRVRKRRAGAFPTGESISGQMHPSLDDSLDTRPPEPTLPTRFPWSAAWGRARAMTSSGTQPEGPFDVVSTAVTRANTSTAAVVDDLRTPHPRTAKALPDVSERASDLGLSMVAGAGFEPATFGL